jgi:tetratricopeptide (TPR) repeat protein
MTWKRLAAFVGPLLLTASWCHAEEGRENGALRMEYGITLALTGDLGRAEAVFSSMLEPGEREAAAWCNLGNIHLVRGEPDVARDLYDRSIALAPEAWGVVLNRALAKMLLGDAPGAREDASRAAKGCGGGEEALALLGIEARTAPAPAAEGESAALLTEEDVRALLASALTEVPADTTGARASPAASSSDQEAPLTTWRPAGTRSAGDEDLARILHWQP